MRTWLTDMLSEVKQRLIKVSWHIQSIHSRGCNAWLLTSSQLHPVFHLTVPETGQEIALSAFSGSTEAPVCADICGEDLLIVWVWKEGTLCLLWKMNHMGPVGEEVDKSIVFFLHSTEINRNAYTLLFHHKAAANCFSVCACVCVCVGMYVCVCVWHNTPAVGKNEQLTCPDIFDMAQMLHQARITCDDKEINK